MGPKDTSRLETERTQEYNVRIQQLLGPPGPWGCAPSSQILMCPCRRHCESLANRRPDSWVSHLGKYWWPRPPLPTHFPASGLGIKNLTSVLCYETSQVLRKEGKRLPLCHTGHDFLSTALTILSVSHAGAWAFLRAPATLLSTHLSCLWH